jgi:hypothetical protein
MAKASRRGATELRRRIRELIKTSKSVPCKDCEKSYPHFVMDFDHVKGEKSFTISKSFKRNTVTYEDVVSEISKTEVVCSNCHRIRTYQREHGQ